MKIKMQGKIETTHSRLILCKMCIKARAATKICNKIERNSCYLHANVADELRGLINPPRWGGGGLIPAE